MLKRLLRKIYLALGLQNTRLGAHAYSVYKRYSGDHPRKIVFGRFPDADGVLVAFKITGGLGDHLVAARYIRDLLSAVGEFRFDVYSSRPELAPWVFGAMPQFNQCYDEYFQWGHRHFYRAYPLALSVNSFVFLQNESARLRLLQRERPKLVEVCETIDGFRAARELEEVIQVHPRLDGFLGAKAVFMNLNRHNFAHEMSGIPYGGDAFPIAIDSLAPSKFGLDGRPYITVHNGFDEQFQTVYGFARRSTKVYPHFKEVVDLLRTRLPNLTFVQVGAKTSTPIENIDVQLIGKTSLPQLAGLLAGALLHLDNESGLVHLAACIGTQSCVLFGPTPAAYFGYDANINMEPKTCGGCWWTTKDWMTDCPRGFDRPICLAGIEPRAIAEAISSRLQKERGILRAQKKPLAFVLGITENLGFAAGNVALSLYKYMRDESYEVVIYYKSLKKADMDVLQKIPNVRLVQFAFPESFEQAMLARMPPGSRFKDANSLMAFCLFEAFSLLDEYVNVAWLDADVAVQANLKDIVTFAPLGITLDTPWPVQNNFTRPIEGYEMNLPGFCTAVMLVNDTLPYKQMYQWCYEKTVEWADSLRNRDQAIINLALQKFSIAPQIMPLEKWQCIFWKDEANRANIVHFGTAKKVWNDTNVCNSFPEWYRIHLQWLELGGSDFDQGRIHPRNPLPSLDYFDRLRTQAEANDIEVAQI